MDCSGRLFITSVAPLSTLHSTRLNSHNVKGRLKTHGLIVARYNEGILIFQQISQSCTSQPTSALNKEIIML